MDGGACRARPARLPPGGGSGTGAGRRRHRGGCSKETKRLKTFQRGMKAAKRRYFRTHRSAKARKRFVKRASAARWRRSSAPASAASPRSLPAPAPQPAPHRQPAPAPPGGGGPGTRTPARHSGARRDRGRRSALPRGSRPGGVDRGRRRVRAHPARARARARRTTAAEMEALLAAPGRRGRLVARGRRAAHRPHPGPGLASPRCARSSPGLAGAPGLAHADLATVPVTTELPDIQPADAGLRQAAAGLARPRDVERARRPRRRAASDAAARRLLRRGPARAGGRGGRDRRPTSPPATRTRTATRCSASRPGRSIRAPWRTSRPTASRACGPGRTCRCGSSTCASASPARRCERSAPAARRRAARRRRRLHERRRRLCAPPAARRRRSTATRCQWIQRVRGSGLEDRFLHVVAAGNIYPNLPNDTAAAARQPRQRRGADRRCPAGREPHEHDRGREHDRVGSGRTARSRPICLTATSKRGGDISAVGNDIKSLAAPGVPRDLPARRHLERRAAGRGHRGGGVGARAVADARRSSPRACAPPPGPSCRHGRRSALRRTRRPRPALDAYAATLAADGAATSPAQAPRCSTPTATATSTSRTSTRSATRSSPRRPTASSTSTTAASTSTATATRAAAATGSTSTRPRRRRGRSAAAATCSGSRSCHDENAVRDLDVLCHEAHGPLLHGRRRRPRHVRRAVLPAAGRARGGPGLPGDAAARPERAAADRGAPHRPAPTTRCRSSRASTSRSRPSAAPSRPRAGDGPGRRPHGDRGARRDGRLRGDGDRAGGRDGPGARPPDRHRLAPARGRSPAWR